MKNIAIISDVGIVVIGRNEGERLVRCLKSLQNWKSSLVYVDSGSNDKSIDNALDAGAVVVELDTSIPFTAARARNRGIEALIELGQFSYVQFIDGDCELHSDWINTAYKFLSSNLDVAAVGGRLFEYFPERSIYNRLCAIEWNTPIGEVDSLGGIALFRLSDFISAGKFDPTLIAGEEPELCLRIRKNGKKIKRIDCEMGKHDADIRTFMQWWTRMKRNGYGSIDVVNRLSGKVPNSKIPFYNMVHSVFKWTIVWLAGTIFLSILGGFICNHMGFLTGMFIGILIWIAQALKIGWGVRKRSYDTNTAMAYGFYTLIGKWPQLLGQIKFKINLLTRRSSLIIEYKK